MSFNELEKDIAELLPEILGELGGTGTVNIIVETTPGGYNTDPTSTVMSFPNILITPPTDYQKMLLDGTFTIKTGFACYVLTSEVTTKPIANNSYLTIHQGNFVDASLVNVKLKITEVNPVQTGKVVTMYELICEG